MIDLSDFNEVSAYSRENANLTYLYVGPKTAMYLKLGTRIAAEIKQYFGTTCRLLVQPITGEIAICRGDAKRISDYGGGHGNGKGSTVIACGTERAGFFENHGPFRKLYFDVRWENDERGNKFVYCEPNGRRER